MNRLHVLFALLLTTALLGACGAPATPPAAQSTTAPAAPAAEPPTQPAAAPTGDLIRIGFSAWPGWIPWQVAVEKNLFAQNGVNVEMVWFEGYLDSINALAAGQIDGNTQTLNDTISSLAAGADQVIVLVNDNSTGNDQIIVAEGINTIADLKGKKIAAEPGTVDHYLLLLGLQQAGLTQADIDFQPMETGAAAAAFAAGQLDGVGVFAPFTTQALSTGRGKVLFSSKDFPGAIPDYLVVSRKLAQERPDDVQKIVKTWFDTLEYIKNNPDEAYEIMARRAGVSVDDYKSYDAGTTIFTIEDNLKAFSPGDNIAHINHAAESVATFLVESKLIETKPDVSRIADDRFVKAYAESQ